MPLSFYSIVRKLRQREFKSFAQAHSWLWAHALSHHADAESERRLASEGDAGPVPSLEDLASGGLLGVQGRAGAPLCPSSALASLSHLRWWPLSPGSGQRALRGGGGAPFLLLAQVYGPRSMEMWAEGPPVSPQFRILQDVAWHASAQLARR